MTPAIAPISPQVFKQILEKDGFCVECETEYNWTLFKASAPKPVIVLPKKGKLVALDIMMAILDQIKMDNGTYFRLLKEATT